MRCTILARSVQMCHLVKIAPSDKVNVCRAVRLTQLTPQHMSSQRSGTIVNITSMGGKIRTPLRPSRRR